MFAAIMEYYAMMKLVIEMLSIAPGILVDVKSMIAEIESADDTQTKIKAVVAGMENILGTLKGQL